MPIRRLVVAFSILLTPIVASAAPRVFVASTGTDTGTCTRTAPCRTFAYAITNTSLGGEVVALDTAGYGPVTVPFSVSIYAAPGEVASISAAGVPGITIAAGSTGVVNIRNLFIISDRTQNGITFTSGAVLTVEDTTFTSVYGGIWSVRTSGTDAVQMSVLNCRFLDSVAGIVARSAGGSVSVGAKNCRFQNLQSGADFSDHAYVGITDSNFTGNAHAVDAASFGPTSTVPLELSFDRCTFHRNSEAFYAAGGAIVRVAHSVIVENASPFVVFSPAQVLSRTEGSSLTNTVESNGDASTFSGTFAAK